jgi:hypothetical protein
MQYDFRVATRDTRFTKPKYHSDQLCQGRMQLFQHSLHALHAHCSGACKVVDVQTYTTNMFGSYVLHC